MSISASTCFAVGTVVMVALAPVLRGVSSALATPIDQGQRYLRMTTNDEGLRKLATHAPTPVYPATSLARKVTGVAVAAVDVDQSGRTQSVEILEAPDEAIAKSVREAVLQWAFKSVGTPASGNLIFYFHFKGREGVISSPQEMKAHKAAVTNSSKIEDEPPVKEIDESNLRDVRKTVNPLVLDIRDRAAFQQSHRDGAINIPMREVLTRAGAELPLKRAIVIDCFPQDYKSNACRVAAHFLTSSGFSQVLLMRR